MSGLSFLPDGRVVIALRNGGRSELRLLDGRGRELKRFALPGIRIRIGSQPAPGLLALSTAVRSRPRKRGPALSWTWKAAPCARSAKGCTRKAGLSCRWAASETQLFVQENGGLVRIDPATGRRHAILRPES